jgi:hypothetical protein
MINDMNEQNIILTNIMSRKTRASQINGYGDDPEPFHVTQFWKIKKFIMSAKDIGARTCILYDDISDELLDLQCDNISFHEYKDQHRQDHCDNRFYLYKKFLEQTDVQKIFLTDCNDVKFNHNPFQIFSSKYDLYVGSEYRDTGWLNCKFRQINKSGVDWQIPDEIVDGVFTRYNMGIIGGNKSNICKFIDYIIQYMEQVNVDIGADSPAGILTLHNHFNKKRIFTGMPLHNHFRMPGTEDRDGTRSKCYIIHK